jgi:hypothetical protein
MRRILQVAAIALVGVHLLLITPYLIFLADAVIGEATGWYRIEDHMSKDPYGR